MDGSELVGSDGAFLVDGLSNHVDNSSQGFGAHWYHDGVAGVHDILASHESLSGVERNRSHVASTQMLGHLEDESVLRALHLQSVKNRGQFSIELHVDDSADNLGYFSR